MTEQIKIHTLCAKFNNPLVLDFGMKYFGDLQHHPNNLHSSLPHSHDSYFIKYLSHGEGTHTIDFVDYKVKPGALFFLSPGQVHSFSIRGAKGFVMYFKKELLAFGDLPFFNYSFNSPALYCDLQKNSIIALLMEKLYKEFSNDLLHKNELIQVYLQALVIEIGRLYKASPQTIEHWAGSKFALLKKLEDLIEQNYKETRSVSFYANQLHLSVRHLNTILNENTKTSISNLIKKRLLTEIKRELLYTNKSIREIAYDFNFNDPSYFHKFFKKNTQQTPEAFRLICNTMSK
ncbi:MAG: AraC family transcriptional regulator [Flavobacteriaceae bacterium]|nr:AraC family transcriptional regulator [Flavobacteriaceae bacterium]